MALKDNRTDCICHQNKLRHVQLLTVSLKKHHESASLMQQPICCTRGCMLPSSTAVHRATADGCCRQSRHTSKAKDNICQVMCAEALTQRSSCRQVPGAPCSQGHLSAMPRTCAYCPGMHTAAPSLYVHYTAHSAPTALRRSRYQRLWRLSQQKHAINATPRRKPECQQP